MNQILQKTTLILSFLAMNCLILHAEWKPEYCFIDKNTTDLEPISHPRFIKLKERVSTYLQGSWCSNEKIDLLMDLILIIRPQVCVEIGACTGSSVLPIAVTLQYLKQGKVFAIDAWSNSETTKYLDDNDSNKAWWGTIDMNAVFNTFQHTLNHWFLQNYCKAIRSPSRDAVHQVDNIDFLHLDGDYSEQGTLEDVQSYLPKVKSGGYILLSNLSVMVNGQQPKLKSFGQLFETCEMVSDIENHNAVLFRKQ